ncbi:hypothetical protein ACFQ3R_14890 [Mesonia ostreae]|uniref:Tetratricopeptide repeat protein n=1 Tax=Mesonia ostreae TaxID=861110 RepID=A0ABU2KLX1_9FLAO|nr:hypothetical protein [Mesonia ostreae]MDT0295699.1 hypothetical protein [Mesonia ostreae]
MALSKTTTWAKEIHIFTSEVVTTKNFTTLVVKGKSLAPFQVQDKKTPRGYLTLSNEIYRQNPQKGLEYLEAGEKLLKKQPNDSLLTEYYLKKGYIFYIQGDYGKAVAEYTKSLEVSKAINHKKIWDLLIFR